MSAGACTCARRPAAVASAWYAPHIASNTDVISPVLLSLMFSTGYNHRTIEHCWTGMQSGLHCHILQVQSGE